MRRWLRGSPGSGLPVWAGQSGRILKVAVGVRFERMKRKMRREGRKKVLVMLAAEGMRVQSPRSSTFGSHLPRGQIPGSAPLDHPLALSSDRLLGGLVCSVLRALVVEVWGPTLFSSLPECSRAGAQRKYLKRHLRIGSVRTSQ